MKTWLLLLLTITLYPNPGQCQPKGQMVVATAYCLKGHTTSGPTTAQVHNRGGCIALSRDLVRSMKAKFGDIIEVDGVGWFIFADLMPPKWKMRVDIYHPTLKQCKVFGVKRCQIRKVNELQILRPIL